MRLPDWFTAWVIGGSVMEFPATAANQVITDLSDDAIGFLQVDTQTTFRRHSGHSNEETQRGRSGCWSDDSDTVLLCPNVPYSDTATDIWRMMNLYLPKQKLHDIPIVLHIQGSAWLGNPLLEMAGWEYPCSHVLQMGIACASISYRPDPWPAQHQDVFAAVRFLHGAGDEYGLSDKIVLHGTSSGGSLAAFVWAMGGHDESQVVESLEKIGPYKDLPATLTGAVLYSSITVLPPLQEPNCTIRGEYLEEEPHKELSCPEAYGCDYVYEDKTIAKIVDPAQYVSSSTAPAFIAHCKADGAVSVCGSVALQQAAAMHGVNTTTLFAEEPPPGVNAHAWYWDDALPNFRSWVQALLKT